MADKLSFFTSTPPGKITKLGQKCFQITGVRFLTFEFNANIIYVRQIKLLLSDFNI